MISKLSYVMRGHGGSLLALLALSAVISFLITFVDPIAMKLLIDRGLGDRDLTLFCIVIGTVVLLALIASGLKLTEALWTQRLKNRVSRDLNQRMLDAFYTMPYAQVAAEGDGYFISRVFDEPRKTTEVVVASIQSAVTNVIALLTAISISLYLSWRVTLVLVFIVPFLYWLSRRFGKKIARESKLENETEAEFRRNLGRGLHSYITTTMFDQRSRVSFSILGSLEHAFAALYQRVRSAAVYRTASGVSMALAESAVLAAAAADVFLGHLTVGGMLAYMAGFWKMMNSATGLIALIPEYSRAYGYIERLQEFESHSANTVEDEGSPAPDLDIEQLGYSYGERAVLDAFDLRLVHGDRVLVIGRNGAGKTTLALIMAGYLRADRGRVQAPGRARTSVMVPPLKFYFATLREHLHLSALDPDKHALAMTMLRELNLETKLDQDPESFSEGERRKAYLVTSLLKDADLYILDEPLAGVDEQSKDVVMNWIARMTREKMLVVIMHGDDRFHVSFQRTLHLPFRAEERVGA